MRIIIWQELQKLQPFCNWLPLWSVFLQGNRSKKQVLKKQTRKPLRNTGNREFKNNEMLNHTAQIIIVLVRKGNSQYSFYNKSQIKCSL